jgi:hypothetical protein
MRLFNLISCDAEHIHLVNSVLLITLGGGKMSSCGELFFRDFKD